MCHTTWDTPALAVLLSCLALPAQDASGIVRGFDGAPVAGAVVSARAANGGGIEVLSGPDGHFVLRCEPAIVALTVQVEGVVVSVPVRNGAARDIEVALADAARTTWRGRVVGPDGGPTSGTELLCRDASGRALASIATDADGTFVLRVGKPLHSIVVEPMGWRHTIVGPFDAHTPLAIDLRDAAGPWFALRGRVIDDDGPLAGTLVVARIDAQRTLRSRTRSDGGYTLWCNTAIERIDVPEATLRRRGPFDGTATAIDLEAREHRLVSVWGRFVDPAGNPIRRAMVFGVERRGPAPGGARPDAITDTNGRFAALLPRGVAFVHAFQESGGLSGTADVPADGSPVEITARR
jgi:hypothetical protein